MMSMPSERAWNLANGYVQHLQSVWPPYANWMRKQIDATDSSEELAPIIVRNAAHFGDIELCPGNPETRFALPIRAFILGPITFGDVFSEDPMNCYTFCIRDGTFELNSQEARAWNMPLYITKSAPAVLFNLATSKKEATKRGRRPLYDQDAFMEEALSILQQRGIPDKIAGKIGWKYKADLKPAFPR